MMPRIACISPGLLLLGLCFMSQLQAAEAMPEPQAVDSRAAHRMVLDDPQRTYIIDVRTRAEYEFVGHPDLPNGVPNIPFKFYPGWHPNPHFVADVAERFKKGDVLITMCRSGKRAQAAARQLLVHGFERVYYMSDSFEGPTDARGHRTVGGWKVNGLPYTYRLDKDLVYKGED